MNPKIISEAQMEVWRCKDKLYQEVKDMNLSEALIYLVKKGENIAIQLRRMKQLNSENSAK
jgi:hypothetical protein